ncbi:TIGR03854 family LLM class F420-dependent oxidoreductase [Yinghuangia seranimata]|uniref:TIGR03854 family LLM class F420-dependent oxidoreductase n=1 Tax=Yinghuangia seranimata TaxID=408067 RepID=UPI00248C6CDA|nr:TIGR03854 family LLM class F420-dependent oxidoreductase [Yinghuangia seranimata]MDI2127971.1 TIGR03854 family LLM class F420-dependent oxidoreductase [Yinghuangia seranimata]
MKIRVGVGLGPRNPADEVSFGALVDRCEKLGVDSLWLPDTVTSDLPDPHVGMAFAAGRTARLKLGTGVSVLPGRNPVAVAKELATLADLAPGRILPAFGLQHARAFERPLFPAPGRRGDVFDEALTLLRRLLGEEQVTFQGAFFACEGITVRPRVERPLDLWLGGSGPAALRRVGRLADGWLAATVTPDEAARGRVAIEAAAAEAGRVVEDDHFGLSLPVAFGDYPEALVRTLRERQPDVDPAQLVPVGWAAARRFVRDCVAGGISKFVIRPATPPASWEAFLDEFCQEMSPLET